MDRYHTKNCNSNRGPQYPCDCSGPFRFNPKRPPQVTAEPKPLSAEETASLPGVLANADPFYNFGRDEARRWFATITTQADRIRELEAQVYVPGQWRCAKCKFTLQRQTIDVAGGRIGVSERDRNEPEKCPNDGSPMWRVSERQVGNELCDRLEEMFEQNKALQTRVEKAEAALKKEK